MSGVFTNPMAMCPRCHQRLDGASVLNSQDGDTAPKGGDISICIGCGLFLTFADDLTLREARTDEWNMLEPEQREELLMVRRWIEHKSRS